MPVNFNIAKDAPLWVQRTAAALLFILASKGMILMIPGVAPAVLLSISLWFDYIMNMISIGFSILMIFSKKTKTRS